MCHRLYRTAGAVRVRRQRDRPVLMMPAWHPLFVHFPLALIVTATGCLSAAWALSGWRHGPVLAVVGTWNLCLGAGALLFALGSGLAAANGVELGVDAHRALSAHVKSAILTALLVLLAAVWRGAGAAAQSRPSSIFLIVLWAATAALTVTGYRGGRNVYEYGIGVKKGADGSYGNRPAPAAMISRE